MKQLSKYKGKVVTSTRLDLYDLNKIYKAPYDVTKMACAYHNVKYLVMLSYDKKCCIQSIWKPLFLDKMVLWVCDQIVYSRSALQELLRIYSIAYGVEVRKKRLKGSTLNYGWVCDLYSFFTNNDPFNHLLHLHTYGGNISLVDWDSLRLPVLFPKDVSIKNKRNKRLFIVPRHSTRIRENVGIATYNGKKYIEIKLNVDDKQCVSYICNILDVLFDIGTVSYNVKGSSDIIIWIPFTCRYKKFYSTHKQMIGNYITHLVKHVSYSDKLVYLV